MAAPAEPVPQPTPAQQPCAPQVHPFSLIPEGAVLNEGLSSFGSGRVLFSGVVPPNARTEINLNVNSQGGNVSLITVGLATKHPKVWLIFIILLNRLPCRAVLICLRLY